jgi:hypothetical protein
MDTAGFLVRERGTIVREAEGALTRLHERHYESVAASEVEKRLEMLFDQLVDAVSKRDLSSIVAYARTVARERFDTGYDLSEVQAAFNVLEAATWTRMIADLEADDLAEGLGLVSTVFGAAKDALGREYVSLATRTRAPSLDLTALFEGTDGV